MPQGIKGEPGSAGLPGPMGPKVKRAGCVVVLLHPYRLPMKMFRLFEGIYGDILLFVG